MRDQEQQVEDNEEVKVEEVKYEEVKGKEVINEKEEVMGGREEEKEKVESGMITNSEE